MTIASGDWVRFQEGGRLQIGVVAYIVPREPWQRTDTLVTDIGAVRLSSVLEARAPAAQGESATRDEAVHAFVARVAAREICEEVPGYHESDSGTYCQRHGLGDDEDIIREARALLRACGHQTQTEPQPPTETR